MKRIVRLSGLAIALLLVDAGAKEKAEKEAAKAEKAAVKAERAYGGGKPENAPPAEPPTKLAGYPAFKNVREKNIFDPTRRGLRIETPSTALSTTTASRGRSLALTGTMVTEGKSLAFFGGSAADGSRVISVGSSVAGYKLTAITPTQVSLDHEGKAITLEVGRQITFESAPGETATAGPIVEVAAEPAADATGTPPVPGPAGDKAEILRRMMERRAKEGGR